MGVFFSQRGAKGESQGELLMISTLFWQEKLSGELLMISTLFWQEKLSALCL
jgi:hypothetical protein